MFMAITLIVAPSKTKTVYIYIYIYIYIVIKLTEMVKWQKLIRKHYDEKVINQPHYNNYNNTTNT